MRFASLTDLTKSPLIKQAKGPVAIIMAEDGAELESTISHHLTHGFRLCLVFAPSELTVGDHPNTARIDYATRELDAVVPAVNAVADALPEGTWLYYGYNAEYLYYPFIEHRTVGEMLDFHAGERRSAMLTYVVDLYAGDLGDADDAVSLRDAFLDRTGYYALDRYEGPARKERQIDVYGGLRWRFEEHVEPERRRIDRIALARTSRDAKLRPDHTWTNEELNTFACPWHHNLTAAIVSFRTAKALRTNPSSRYEIDSFRWYNSTPFEWSSQQLMDLGLMEPGQWF